MEDRKKQPITDEEIEKRRNDGPEHFVDGRSFLKALDDAKPGDSHEKVWKKAKKLEKKLFKRKDK